MPLIEFRHMPGDDLKTERASKKVYTRTFVGRHTNPGVNNLEVLADPLVPAEMAPDPYDTDCLVVARQAKRRPRALELWDITITSTTEVDSFENPLQAPAIWDAETRLYEVPLVKDIKGNWITNTAGDLIEGSKGFVLGWMFTATVSIPDAPITWSESFINAVNDRTVNIKGKPCQEKTVWMESARIGKPQRDNGVTHCPSTFTFHQNPLGWLYRPLNQGYRELRMIKQLANAPLPSGAKVITTYEMQEIRDANGERITKPVFLDENGAQYRIKAADGRMILKTPLDPTDIITLEFEVKNAVDFNVLGIFR